MRRYACILVLSFQFWDLLSHKFDPSPSMRTMRRFLSIIDMDLLFFSHRDGETLMLLTSDRSRDFSRARVGVGAGY